MEGDSVSSMEGDSISLGVGSKYPFHSPWFPDPVVCLREMLGTMWIELNRRLLRYEHGVGEWLSQCVKLTVKTAEYADWSIVLLPVSIAVVLLLARMVLDNYVLKPFLEWYQLPRELRWKFHASSWKAVVYLVSWCWAAYLLFTGDHQYFFRLTSHFDRWSPGMRMPSGPYYFYLFQTGFYMYSIFALFCVEAVQKDFAVMVVHHLLGYCLLVSSYAIRLHIHGILMVFFMDLGDVLLELSKILFYLRKQGSRTLKAPKLVANVTFFFFTLQFILFRIYWYPTKFLYSCMYVVVLVYPNAPYYLYLAVLVTAVYFMQIYWLYYILKLLWKVLVRGEEPKDTRDYEKLSKKHFKKT